MNETPQFKDYKDYLSYECKEGNHTLCDAPEVCECRCHGSRSKPQFKDKNQWGLFLPLLFTITMAFLAGGAVIFFGLQFTKIISPSQPPATATNGALLEIDGTNCAKPNGTVNGVEVCEISDCKLGGLTLYQGGPAIWCPYRGKILSPVISPIPTSTHPQIAPTGTPQMKEWSCKSLLVNFLLGTRVKQKFSIETVGTSMPWESGAYDCKQIN